MIGLPLVGDEVDVVIYHDTTPPLDIHTEGKVIAVNSVMQTYDVQVDLPSGEVRQLELDIELDSDPEMVYNKV